MLVGEKVPNSSLEDLVFTLGRRQDTVCDGGSMAIMDCITHSRMRYAHIEVRFATGRVIPWL